MLWALGVSFGKQKELHLEAFASCFSFVREHLAICLP